MRALRPWVLIVLILIVFIGQAVGTDIPSLRQTQKAVLLRTNGSGAGITQDQVTTSLSETARAMNLQDRDLPRVMVSYLSRDAAQALGVTGSQVHRNTSMASGIYYEIWLVEDSPLVDCARAMQSILERHFELAYTDPQRQAIIEHVAKYVNATVSAKDLAR